MKFFNKKEDVIDLEITPYGEYILGQGDFKPVYYAFYDDGILYDGKYGGLNHELQSEIKERIKDVPRLKTQAHFRDLKLPTWDQKEGPDVTLGGTVIDAAALYQRIIDHAAGFRRHDQPVEVKQHTLPLPLGQCSLDAKEAPAWKVNFLYGKLRGAIETFSASAHPYLKIPQLDATIHFETEVFFEGDPDPQKEYAAAGWSNDDETSYLDSFTVLHESLPVFPDGSYINFKEDHIMLEIEEENVPFLKENFDIEVFEIVGKTLQNERFEELIPLSFTKHASTVVDEKGLLKSFDEQAIATERELELELTPLNDTYVEHFFNVYVDKEIDKKLICKLRPPIKKKGVFTTDPLECEDLKTAEFGPSGMAVYPTTAPVTPECDT